MVDESRQRRSRLGGRRSPDGQAGHEAGPRSHSPDSTPWQRFWDSGGWWKAVLVAAVYFVLYQLADIAFVALIGQDALGAPGSAQSVLLATAVPIAVGGVILVAFAYSIGWLRELFGTQPTRGAWWMWIAVVVVLLFNLLRFATLDYAAAGLDVVAAWLLAGLCVGFAEELLTRGLAVNLLRRAGHGEWVVMMVSSAIFAALHAGNLLGGQSLFATLFQIVYTFGFGICMYLTLRVTGHLIWPILLHASTDPSTFLFTEFPGESPLAGIANLGNFAVILTGLVLLFFVRGRVTRDIRRGHTTVVSDHRGGV